MQNIFLHLFLNFNKEYYSIDISKKLVSSKKILL